MKKKIVLMSIAAVLTMTAIIGGTLAGFNTQSRQGKTDITTKALGIDLVGDSIAVEAYMPGAEVSVPYYVVNDVEDGYDLYTRVTIYKHWDDFTLDADKISLYVKGTDGKAVELTADENGGSVQVNNWFIQYADDEQIILYYARPLASGEATEHVLDSLVVDAKIDNTYANQKVILEIQADAVQKIAAESSIPSEWGVYPSFDENGNIVSIAE